MFPLATVTDLIAMTGTVCHRCGHPGGIDSNKRPWCGRCEIWLVLDDQTGHWVSYAEREWRERERVACATLERATHAARTALPLVIAELPTDWSTSLDHGAIEIRPPAGPVNVTAYLSTHSTGSWLVCVVNRTSGVGAAIFRAGYAARYDTAADAARDALGDLRYQAARTRTRR